MTMSEPKTELEQRCPSPPYTRWDQRGKPVLLAYLKRINGKSLCLSLETENPEVAKRHMRLLVAMLLAKGRLSPDCGAAEAYGPKGTGRSRIEKLKTEVRRLTALSDAKYGPETLATAKRWGCPVGIIHHLAGRKPELSAGTHRTRRMRARKRGEQIAKGASWHYRRRGGKNFYLNGGVMNARLEIAGRKYMWVLPTRDRDEAAAIMEPVRVARERVGEAANRVLNYKVGSVDYVDAVRTRENACIAFAAAILHAGGPNELAKIVQDPPSGEAGAAVPQRADDAAPRATLRTTERRLAAEKEREQLLIERYEAYVRNGRKREERPLKDEIRTEMTELIPKLSGRGFDKCWKATAVAQGWDWTLPGLR
jgi:hypothetical protein